MKQMFGNMWDEYNGKDVFVVTTNSFIKSNGELVMGRGAAKVARDRFQIALALGTLIHSKCGSLGRYGFLGVSRANLAAFQVKYHFKSPASLELIGHSTAMLSEFALENPSLIIHLNYPGIGNGGLPIEEVAPIISTLPDNVNVWRFKR